MREDSSEAKCLEEQEVTTGRRGVKEEREGENKEEGEEVGEVEEGGEGGMRGEGHHNLPVHLSPWTRWCGRTSC